MAKVSVAVLRARLDELRSKDENSYDEIPGWDGFTVEALTDSAVLLPCEGDKKVWFPLTQLRTVDKEVAASKWILAQKGLE